jgi:hypothetical protein
MEQRLWHNGYAIIHIRLPRVINSSPLWIYQHIGMDHLTAYYVNQSGSRLGDYIGPLYVGSPYIQQGNGLGSFLSSLFRIVKPVLFSGAKSIGKAALTTGADIMNDIANKQEGSKIKDIVANRVSESIKGLTDKLQQRGKGRKRRREPVNASIKKKVKCKDVFA